VRGAQYHTQKSGKIERWHRLKNRIRSGQLLPARRSERDLTPSRTLQPSYHRASTTEPPTGDFGRAETLLTSENGIKRATIAKLDAAHQLQPP